MNQTCFAKITKLKRLHNYSELSDFESSTQLNLHEISLEQSERNNPLRAASYLFKMKKVSVLFALILLSATAFSIVPTVTLTSSKNGSLSFSIAFKAAGTFDIDWGNGTLVSQTASTSATSYSTNTYIAGKIVKIYGSEITAMDVISQQITSLDVSACTKLLGLTCSSNQLTTLDVSNNTALTYLDCKSNQLTALNISNNMALSTLWCSSNQLITIDISKNTALGNIGCDYNQLNTLDVSKNMALSYLSCYSNQLTTLDVSNNTALTTLTCNYNKLTTLDVSKNTALLSLTCTNNQLTTLDASTNKTLTFLNCSSNKLTALNVSTNTALSYLLCNENQLTALDVSKSTPLKEFYCHFNQLTELSVSNSTALTILYCDHNHLTTLDVSKNTALTTLSCYSNQLNTLDVSNNAALTTLYCNLNQLSALDVSKNTALTSLYCASNKLNYASLPQKKSSYTFFNYAPQSNLATSVTCGIVNLSSQLKAKDVSGTEINTAYLWYTKTGTALTPGVDYSETNGVFTFLKTPLDSVYCTMTNTAFPDFTSTNILRTVNIKVALTPILTTQAVTNIGTNTCTGNGNIFCFGVSNPTQYGVVWSTATNPTVALTTKTEQGTVSTTGAFTSSMTGLISNTRYYVKAYATNSQGTSYGEEVTFITKNNLTVTAVTDTKIYNGNTSSTRTPIIGTLATGDIVNIAPKQVFDNENVGTTHVLKASGLTIKNGSNEDVTDNYIINYVQSPATGNITSKALTIVSASAQNKVYDGETNATVIGATLNGVETGDVVTLNIGIASFANKTVATGKIITVSGSTLSGADATNYSLTEVSGLTADITPKLLTVTANNANKTYGDVNPALTVDYSGFAGTENETSLTTAPTATTTATKFSDATTYSIVPAGGEASNYTFAYVNGMLTITKAQLDITADNATRKKGSANLIFALSYEGFKGTDGVSVIDVLPTAASTADASSPEGVYDIVLTGGADNNYSLVLHKGTLTVTPATDISQTNAVAIRVYPNPASNYIYIDNLPVKTTIRIYNFQGVLIKNSISNNSTEQIDINGLPAGVYMIHLSGNKIETITHVVIR